MQIGPGARKLIDWAEAFISAAVVVFILFFVFWPLKSEGIGMSPTLIPGDRIFISRAATTLGLIKHGDVVICAFQDEDGNWGDAVMRVIGVPQDMITISGGAVSVNGTVLREDYLLNGMETYPDTFFVLNNSQYFLLGDNRPVSGDSRVFGPVDRRNISSKVLMRFFPINTIKLF